MLLLFFNKITIRKTAYTLNYHVYLIVNYLIHAKTCISCIQLFTHWSKFYFKVGFTLLILCSDL
jgi:hypothetical protein